MTFKEAKSMFDDIIDLCYQMDDKNLKNAIESIYQEAKKTMDPPELLELTSELMFYVDEISPYDHDIEDVKSEILELYNKMQDALD